MNKKRPLSIRYIFFCIKMHRLLHILHITHPTPCGHWLMGVSLMQAIFVSFSIHAHCWNNRPRLYYRFLGIHFLNRYLVWSTVKVLPCIVLFCIFSCEEAALEVQMSVCVSVCLIVWPQNWILPRLCCLKCTQTNWLYKGIQNHFTVQVYTKLVYWLIMYTKPVGNVLSLYIP